MGHFTTTGVTIYAACLASYNAGKLHGEWFDLDDCTDLDELQDQVAVMLGASSVDNATEYRIDDYEQLPYVPGTLEQAWAMHELIQEHGDVARAALSYDQDVAYATERCENSFGVYGSYEDIGAQQLEEYDIPSAIEYHVDCEGLGKDYASNYIDVEWDGSIYLFGS